MSNLMSSQLAFVIAVLYFIGAVFIFYRTVRYLNRPRYSYVDPLNGTYVLGGTFSFLALSFVGVLFLFQIIKL